MTHAAYRYAFTEHVPIEEAEESLLLAIFAVESLHGVDSVRLDLSHSFDLAKRSCLIGADTQVGKDLNRVFIGFLRREFGASSFRVERIRGAEVPSPTSEPAAC